MKHGKTLTQFIRTDMTDKSNQDQDLFLLTLCDKFSFQKLSLETIILIY